MRILRLLSADISTANHSAAFAGRVPVSDRFDDRAARTNQLSSDREASPKEAKLIFLHLITPIARRLNQLVNVIGLDGMSR